MYSKGDTIKFEDGRVVLVLNSGIKGGEFYAQYKGLVMTVIGPQCFVTSMSVHTGFSHHLPKGFGDHYPREEHVWYNVLLGDVKGWSTELTMSRW